MSVLNAEVAERLEEVAQILEEQGANPFRVRAYRRAAATVRNLPTPADALFEQGGLAALEALSGIGPSLARSIAHLVTGGRLPMLDRLRGETDPVELLETVPGIGRTTAERLHHDLGIDTLEELEAAAHDGRLSSIGGFGTKRLAGVRQSLAQRLGRVRRERPAHDVPPVAELLDVDAEYRGKAATAALQKIAPRRLNPEHRAWLPILHTHRGNRHYTALYSNSPRAHDLGMTLDWVILYVEDAGHEGQWTVITARYGTLASRRIVRGRELECASHYGVEWSARPGELATT